MAPGEQGLGVRIVKQRRHGVARREFEDDHQLGAQSPSITVGGTPRTMYRPPCFSMSAGMAAMYG
jgi:hypothetical protein